MTPANRLHQFLKDHYPWLATDFNGATWESAMQEKERRIAALEAHLVNLEDRYADLETRFNHHAKGQVHVRSRQSKPEMG